MTNYEQPVSGSDLYHKLGTLEGKVDALIARTSEYRTDLQSAFDRISAIENRQSWIMGAAIVVSLVIPFVTQIIFNNYSVRIMPAERIEQLK